MSVIAAFLNVRSFSVNYICTSSHTKQALYCLCLHHISTFIKKNKHITQQSLMKVIVVWNNKFIISLFTLFQMLTVKPVWSLECCLMTTVVPISSRRWWARWRLPRRRRWSTSRASCSCRAFTTMLTLSYSRNEAKVWIRWFSTIVGFIWISAPACHKAPVFNFAHLLIYNGSVFELKHNDHTC